MNQIYQFLSSAPTWYPATKDIIDASFIDHHPVLNSIIYGTFVTMGRALGSDALGLFLFGICQSAFTAIALAGAICYLERLGVAPIFRLASIAFVVLYPVFPISADTMQKDSTFAPFFLLYTICFFEIFRTRGKAAESKRFVVAFIALSCMCALTKKTGIYLVVLCAIVLVVFFKQHRKASVAMLVAPVLICSVILPAIFVPLLDIAPGGKQEVLGILYQQSATVLKEAPDDVTDEERNAIDGVIDTDNALKHYKRIRTDGVKRRQRKEVNSDQLAAYLKVWAAQGLRHPDLYFKSVFRCVSKSVIPSTFWKNRLSVSVKSIEIYRKHARDLGTEFDLDAASPSSTQNIIQPAYKFFVSTFKSMPAVSLFCTCGFYGGWLPLICLILVLYKRKRNALAYAPIIVSVLVLLASPASLPRYVLPLLYTSILALGWVAYSYKCRQGYGIVKTILI